MISFRITARRSRGPIDPNPVGPPSFGARTFSRAARSGWRGSARRSRSSWVRGGTPAYAVTTNGDGSVLVTINQNSALPDANAKLAAMGIHEVVIIFMASGPAPVSGPVACTPAPGTPKPPGPPVKVLVGTNGTEVIAPGTTGDNTGVGTWHLAACQLRSDPDGSGNSGGG